MKRILKKDKKINKNQKFKKIKKSKNQKKIKKKKSDKLFFFRNCPQKRCPGGFRLHPQLPQCGFEEDEA